MINFVDPITYLQKSLFNLVNWCATVLGHTRAVERMTLGIFDVHLILNGQNCFNGSDFVIDQTLKVQWQKFGEFNVIIFLYNCCLRYTHIDF